MSDADVGGSSPPGSICFVYSQSINFSVLDPTEHPQSESYWGNVNPVGPRSCYDEGKRAGETLCYAYSHRVTIINIEISSFYSTLLVLLCVLLCIQILHNSIRFFNNESRDYVMWAVSERV